MLSNVNVFNVLELMAGIFILVRVGLYWRAEKGREDLVYWICVGIFMIVYAVLRVANDNSLLSQRSEIIKSVGGFLDVMMGMIIGSLLTGLWIRKGSARLVEGETAESSQAHSQKLLPKLLWSILVVFIGILACQAFRVAERPGAPRR